MLETEDFDAALANLFRASDCRGGTIQKASEFEGGILLARPLGADKKERLAEFPGLPHLLQLI